MLDLFKYRSYRERYYVERNLPPMAINIQFTPRTGYDRHDYTFECGERLFIVEVKVRTCSSEEHDDTLLEKDKFDYLLDRADRMGAIPLLHVFFTTDKKMVIINLNKHRGIASYSGECPATTSKESETGLKENVYIPISRDRVVDFYMPPCDEVLEAYQNELATLKK